MLKAAPDLQKLDEEAIRILPCFPLFSKMDGELAQNQDASSGCRIGHDLLYIEI